MIGTFNVESLEPRAFTESDLQFLEIFGRDVAAALNTLELLVAERASMAAESCEAIHSAVALPVDEILNEAVNVMERYIGHEPEVVERLQRILRNARDIKQVIQKVGQTMTPAQAHPAGAQVEERPVLKGRRVLVADADENVRSAAHALLDRYGCTVETAHDGAEAVYMVRALRDEPYDVIIADIRLPDMNGYELMLKLQEVLRAGAAGADDRVRLRSGALDRQRPQGRPARLGHPLQAVPPGPAPHRRRAHHPGAGAGRGEHTAGSGERRREQRRKGAGEKGSRGEREQGSKGAGRKGERLAANAPRPLSPFLPFPIPPRPPFPAPPSMDIALLLLALLGHAALWVAVVNRTHAIGWRRPVVMRVTAVLLGRAGGPAGWCWRAGWCPLLWAGGNPRQDWLALDWSRPGPAGRWPSIWRLAACSRS